MIFMEFIQNYFTDRYLNICNSKTIMSEDEEFTAFNLANDALWLLRKILEFHNDTFCFPIFSRKIFSYFTPKKNIF